MWNVDNPDLLWQSPPGSFPHSASLVHQHSGGGVQYQTSSSLPPSHSVCWSFWKNYSDICMCHGYRAPGSYPPTSLGFPCQPAPHLYRPASSPLRHTSLKLLNMANCVRREVHFIWIFWLGGDLPFIGEELSKDVWKKGGSTIRYSGLSGVKFYRQSCCFPRR